MVGQNVNKLILVLRLEQRVQSSLRKSTKGLICRSKDGERTWRAECFGEISCHHSRHQSGEIIHRLRQLHNVWFVIAFHSGNGGGFNGNTVNLNVELTCGAFTPDGHPLDILQLSGRWANT